ncbi:hypothetical protein CPT_Marzo_079 [Stenotrophomonas phage Marzo]|nr:hypothetical protein CPT_Marzo_079 [Stenotrophomonas phage Marzo]
MNKIQKRGICQVCGREQAVNKGVMAKHGYTVEYGFFEGTCPGAGNKPLNETRELLDIIIGQQNEFIAEMEVLVEGLKNGKKFPKQVKVWKLNKYEMVDFNDLNEYQKEREVQIAIVNTEGMIKSRQNWIKMMDALAVATLGTDLREVEQVAGPARIGSGEKKVSGSGRVLTSLYQDGARVYYNYTNDAGKVLKGWVGSAAWRKLADA